MPASKGPQSRQKVLFAVGAAVAVAGAAYLLYRRRIRNAAALTSAAMKTVVEAINAQQQQQQSGGASPKPTAGTGASPPSSRADANAVEQNDEAQPPISAEDEARILEMSRQFKDAGNTAISRGELDKALEMYQRGMALLRHLPQGHSEGTPLLQVICCNTVLIFLKQARNEEAAFLATCVLEDQHFPVQSPDIKGKLLFRRAQAATKLGNVDAALADLAAASAFASGKMKEEILDEKSRLEKA